jgi:hypothetical protein
MRPNQRVMIAVTLLGTATLATLLLLAPAAMDSRSRWLVAASVALAMILCATCLLKARLPASGASVGFAFAAGRATMMGIYGIGTLVLAGCAWAGLAFAWLLPLEIAWLGVAIGIDAILDRASRHGTRVESEQLAARRGDASTKDS